VSVLESMPGSVHENVLGVLRSVLRVYLGVCHRVQLKESLRACPGVYLVAS